MLGRILEPDATTTTSGGVRSPMSYARNLLSRGEEVVHESRQHWFAIIARTWLWILLAVVALAIVIFLVSGTEPFVNETMDQIVTLLAVAGLLIAAASLGFALLAWRFGQAFVHLWRGEATRLLSDEAEEALKLREGGVVPEARE